MSIASRSSGAKWIDGDRSAEGQPPIWKWLAAELGLFSSGLVGKGRA